MSIIAGQFPNSSELARISTLNKYDKLYSLEHYGILNIHPIIKRQYKNINELVYLAHSIPARISEFYGDFVQGDVARMVISTKDEGELKKYIDTTVYENDLKEKVYDIGVEQSEFGFAVIFGYKDENGIFKIQLVGQDQYFPQPDGSVIFASYTRHPNSTPEEKRVLLYTQEYRMEGDNVVIHREAWNTDATGVAMSVFSFDSFKVLMNTPNLLQDEVIEGLGELPIRQIDNGRRTKWGFGKSDYADILPQLSEINERATHISTVLLKNLDSKLVIPASSLDENGKPRQAETYVMASKDDVKPEYITNNNPFIEETQIHIDKQAKWISWITGVPMWEILKSSAPERVESLRIQLFAAIRKTDTKRAKIKRALNDLLRIGAKMMGLQVTEDFIIDFTDALPTDDYITAQTEELKTRSGLSSKRSAMKRLDNLTDDQIDKEFAEIESESKITGLGEPANAPTFQPNV